MSDKEKLNKIRLFVMDVDGTLTNGKIYMGQDGELMKAFNAKDGYGVKLLSKNDIIPAIITGRYSKIVENRCREIGIQELYQGIQDKDAVLTSIMEKYHLTTEQVAYIGDDLNDASAMKLSGVTFAPADCHKQLIPYVDYVLTKNGGDCAVREAVDKILSAREHVNLL